MRPRATRLIPFLLLCPAFAADTDHEAERLLRRSLAAEEDNRKLASFYLYREEITQRLLSNSGEVLDQAAQTYEVIYLANKPYFRLVARDGRPLDASEREAEERRMQAVAAERQAGKIDGSERPRISVGYELLPDAHHLRLLGEERIDGRDTWLVEARPKGGGKGSGDLRDRETRAMRIKVWIDRETLLRVRLEAEVLRKAGRVNRGYLISYRFGPQPDGVWLIERILLKRPAEKVDGMRTYQETEQVYSNYRKFQADSKVLEPAIQR